MLIPVYHCYAAQYWYPQGQRNIHERLLPTLQLFSPLSHKKKGKRFIHSPPQSPYPKNKLQSSRMQVRNAPKHYMHLTSVKGAKWLHVSLVERMILLSSKSRFHPLIHLVSVACHCRILDGFECKAAAWHFKWDLVSMYCHDGNCGSGSGSVFMHKKKRLL